MRHFLLGMTLSCFGSACVDYAVSDSVVNHPSNASVEVEIEIPQPTITDIQVSGSVGDVASMFPRQSAELSMENGIASATVSLSDSTSNADGMLFVELHGDVASLSSEKTYVYSPSKDWAKDIFVSVLGCSNERRSTLAGWWDWDADAEVEYTVRPGGTASMRTIDFVATFPEQGGRSSTVTSGTIHARF